jgi:hypothetical protein
VSFEGKKLAMGQVYVIGSDSNPYYAVIGEDGVYAFKDLPGGICKIAVNSPNPAAAGGRKDGGKDRPKDADNKPADDPKKWIAIPLSYGDQSTSQLEFDIKGGENAFDIKMVKK